MSGYISGAIQIAAAILFIALMLGATLAQLEVWTPKDPRTKNRLWLALLVPLIAFGVSFIKAPPPTEPLAPAAATRTTLPTAAPPSTGGVPLSPPATPNASAAPASPGNGTAGAAGIPADVSAWARENLGERPLFSAEFAQQYPPCVADLRRPGVTATAADVRACTRALDTHHASYIIAFYTIKRPYDEALDRTEAALRVGGVAEDELANYDYVRDEITRLNGSELDKVSAAEARFAADRSACRTNQCRLPN